MLRSALAEERFFLFALAAPRYAGKTRLLFEFSEEAHEDAISCYLDLDEVTGLEDVVTSVLASADPGEFPSLKESLVLIDRGVELDRTRIRNSQVMIHNSLSAQRLKVVLAKSLAADFALHSRPLLLALDNTPSCTPDASAAIELMVRAMRTRGRGVVVAEKVTEDVAARVLGNRKTGPDGLAVKLLDKASSVELPRLDAAEISRWAEQMGIVQEAEGFDSLATTSGGLAGLVFAGLLNIAHKLDQEVFNVN
ncbi:hypothetical protein AB0395_45930 [Streptosporangium sp. NPDC051023]|uniref:hypothetical protein n=1 Tax=Streptosporangium sp. NPDC051023 TaxID=3155410 RepID=UPI00344C8CC9